MAGVNKRKEEDWRHPDGRETHREKKLWRQRYLLE